VKFKLDENLPASAAAILETAGHDAGIVVLRPADQSAATVSKAIADLTSITEPESLVGANTVLQRGLLRIRRP